MGDEFTTVVLVPADIERLDRALAYEMGRQLTNASFAEMNRDRKLAVRCAREYEELAGPVPAHHRQIANCV